MLSGPLQPGLTNLNVKAPPTRALPVIRMRPSSRMKDQHGWASRPGMVLINFGTVALKDEIEKCTSMPMLWNSKPGRIG